MVEAVIVSACRTAIGEFQGGLKAISTPELGATVIREAILRAKADPKEVDEVIMGCVLPHGLGQNPARQAILKGKLPFTIECVTLNKVCGSGLKAVMDAAHAVQCGDAELVVAGGMENMSQAPYLLPKARSGYRMGDGKLIDAMVWDGLWDSLNNMHMGLTAEHIAEEYKISREDMDLYAKRSYDRALAAQASGAFEAEIVPVLVPQGKGDPQKFVKDELPRETGIESLAKLKPAFKPEGGCVTAGNSSKIADGAAAVVVTTPERAKKLKAPILARILAQGAAAQDPMEVLVTPILSIPKILQKANLSLNDIDLHEVNEAFSVSTLAVQRTLGIPEDRLNVFGGSVALGHPIGASGCRVLVTLLNALARLGKKRGMASLCLGGGESVSLIIERP